jgi:ribonucleoside-diphosphate reductase alpha chain
MPEDATVQDIFDIYVQAWRLGLKAIAIYRDGCKKAQPLSTGKAKKEEEKKPAPAPDVRPARRTLPVERAAITHKFAVAGHEGYITVGLYEDGAPGELFITMSKEGSTISGLMDTIATSISLALQYGVPLRVLVDRFSHMRFEPSGFTGNKDIPMAKSIVDYIFRWLGLKFLREEDGHVDSTLSAQAEAVLKKSIVPGQIALPMKADKGAEGPVKPVATPAKGGMTTQSFDEKEIFRNQADAPPCHVCGTITVRAGACYCCPNCGATSGCS